jgi:hypothetical protein
MRLTLGQLLVAGAVWLQQEPATALTVTSGNDSGVGTLRWAIKNSEPDDTITVAVGSVSISTEIVIDHNLTILGAAQPIAIDAGFHSRVFNVASNVTVSISGLKLLNAVASAGDGGAIYNAGTLALSGCWLFYNRADPGNGGAIQNSGMLTVSNCTFSSNRSYPASPSQGGAINNLGTLVVNNSLFWYNDSGGTNVGYGGAIATTGALTVNNTTFYQNSCGSGYGGLGGALYYSGYALTVNNCTFSQNYCTAQGTYSSGGAIYLNVYGGGNGIRNTIFAANHADAGPDARGSVASAGHNLIGAVDGSSGWVASDLTGRDPLLGPLSYNGGPTESMMLAPNSPAIDAGDDAVLSSLIAGNSALSGPDCSGQLPGTLNWGAFTSQGYNLVGKTNRYSGFSVTSHDQLGSIDLPLDPKLGPLQDNGGSTPTLALLTGSPAIDQGSSPGLSTDQCGQQRPFDFDSVPNPTPGDGSDIGAFEMNPPVLIGNQEPGTLGMSWYGGGAVYHLESTTGLNATAVWTTAPVTPTVVGGRYFVTIPFGQGNRFYRLKSP